MNQSQHNKTSLFLMELIISILFFSIAGAICVRLFVGAHLMSQESIVLNNSVLWTQNMSELFNAKKGNLREIADFCSENSIVLVSYEDNPEIGTLVMFFDKNWDLIYYPANPGALDDAAYELMLCISQLPASEVYSDTAVDTSKLLGDALVGEIQIQNMSDETIIEVFADEDDPTVITTQYVDYYIGIEEAANES